ncbi:MAG TPA: hypothetical protein VG388_12150 [Solirubrobacteraceae bacterium]|nr:hypothetical protein [Solirubrobacteraceae bacterium]
MRGEGPVVPCGGVLTADRTMLAAELGMATVHHHEASETIAEPERLVGVAMR